MTATIATQDTDILQALVERAAPNSRKVQKTQDGITVSDSLLSDLSALPEHEDGHYDGQRVYFAGDGYDVTR